jgi:hypothetical protein
MGVFRWWGGALTVRVDGRGVCGGCRREGREFSLSEWEDSSSPSLKFMGMRRVGFEVVVVVDDAGGVVVVLFWGESWAIGVLEWLRTGV